MPKFYVYVPEVHYQTVSITASTPEEAVKLVDDGEGEYLDSELEYSHRLDTGEQRVRNAETGQEVTIEADNLSEED